MKENTKASGHSSNNDIHVQNVLPKYKNFLINRDYTLEAKDLEKCLNECRFVKTNIKSFLKHIKNKHNAPEKAIWFYKTTFKLFTEGLEVDLID